MNNDKAALAGGLAGTRDAGRYPHGRASRLERQLHLDGVDPVDQLFKPHSRTKRGEPKIERTPLRERLERKP